MVSTAPASVEVSNDALVRSQWSHDGRVSTRMSKDRTPPAAVFAADHFADGCDAGVRRSEAGGDASAEFDATAQCIASRTRVGADVKLWSAVPDVLR